MLKTGSYEYNLYKAVPKAGISQSNLMTSVPNAKIGFSKAMANKWIRMLKTDGNSFIYPTDEDVEDITATALSKIKEGTVESVSAKFLNELKKRKLISETMYKSFLIEKGENFTLKPEKLETDLTAQMIKDGSWRNKVFKEYNYNALGAPPAAGHLHPLLKTRSAYRQIFLEMGFTEMPTNNFVESSFWNFDTLFQPQQHPARDAHDTFFISDPRLAHEFPEDYLERVRKVHSEGGYGSQVNFFSSVIFDCIASIC